ncbi:MAG: hypothetical protein V7646_7718, partial [Pseudonocardia sp.]
PTQDVHELSGLLHAAAMTAGNSTRGVPSASANARDAR